MGAFGNRRLTLTAAVALAQISFRLWAADVQGSVKVSSAYVFRGQTLNDGIVIQPGLEVRHGPWLLGGWANLDAEDDPSVPELRRGQFSEIDLYADWNIPCQTRWLAATLEFAEYTYPGRSVRADRWGSLKLRGLLAGQPSLEVAYGLGGAVREDLYLEAGISHTHPVRGNLMWKASAAVAWAASSHQEDGFSHGTVSMGLDWRGWSLSATYVARIDSDVLPDTSDAGGMLGYEVRAYGTLGYACSL